MAHKHNCPVFQSADLIGKKWTMIILQEILHDHNGFNTLFTSIKKISPKILSQRLHELERNGIVEKHLITQKPLQTRYTITEKGKELYAILETLKQWNIKHADCPHDCLQKSCVTCPLV